LPALTKFYGLTPMDVDQMTFREVSEYRVQMMRAQSEG
jgi:hypothetical protein